MKETDSEFRLSKDVVVPFIFNGVVLVEGVASSRGPELGDAELRGGSGGSSTEVAGILSLRGGESSESDKRLEHGLLLSDGVVVAI